MSEASEAMSRDDPAITPDSPLVADFQPSPNHDRRRGGRRPDMLILHYTGMASAAAALERLCDPESGVSSHYVVLEDGRILQLVAEARRAWHAGAGSWAGEHDINSCSIGIEIAHPGHAGGLPPYPEAQIAAMIALSRDIVDRWEIAPERVLGHSDTAPARKEDPGELFPWDRFAAAGIGHWVAPDPAGPPEASDALGPGATGPEIEALLAALAAYGYGIDPGAAYDDATATTVTAFQRHFRPERVDGIADASTIATLRRLIAALGRR